MNRKRIILYTRNLNEGDNLRQAMSMLQQIPGVCDVHEDDMDTQGGSRPLATRLMVEYDTNDTAPNALASELSGAGFPVVLQEEPGDDVMHVHPTRGVRDDHNGNDHSEFAPPATMENSDYRTTF